MILFVSSCGSLDQSNSIIPDETENPKEEIKDSNESKDNTDATVPDDIDSSKEESKEDKDSDKVYDDNIVWGPLS